MKKTDFHNLRIDYHSEPLHKKDLNKNPIQQFQKWFQDALEHQIPDANAFVLSTVSNNYQLSSRVVLLKEVQENGIVFYTNYNSKKSRQIAEKNIVAACFFWQPMHRQIRIEGKATKISESASDAYFESRPLESKIGAIVSPQSEEITSREWLKNQWEVKRKEVGSDPARPEHWGGYLITIESIEFWQGQPGRLHDRFVYEQQDGEWKIRRLAP